VWSWGLSVLEMFVGKLTWDEGEGAAQALKHCLEEGPARAGIPDMPAGLAVLLKQCFELQPTNRPKNLVVVADILQQIYCDVARLPYERQPPKAADMVAATLNNRALSLLDLAKTASSLSSLNPEKIQEAMECWRKALQADPTHFESTFNWGYWQWNAGQVDDDWFVKRLTALKPLHGSRPEYWTQMAAIQAERGDQHEARQALAEISANGTSAALPGTYPDFHLAYTWKLAAGISALALSSDGSQMLVGGTDKQVGLFDLTTHECLLTFAVPRSFEVNALAFSVQERYALTGGFSEEVTIWDLQSSDQHSDTLTHTTLTHPAFKESSADSISAIIFSQRCGLLAWACRSELPMLVEQPIWLWDLKLGRFTEPLDGHRHSVFSIAFSPDGQYLLSGGRFLGRADEVMKLWDMESRRCIRTFIGHSGSVKAVAFTRDGQYAISGSDDTTLKVWEAKSARLVKTLQGHTDTITSLALSPDGAFLVSASEDKTVRIWDLSTGRCVRTLDAHEDTVTSVILSPDGSVLFSASRDGTVRMWSMHWSTGPRVEYLVSVPVSSSEAIEMRERIEHLLKESDEFTRQGSYQAAYQMLRDAQHVPGYEKSSQILDHINHIGKMMHRVGLGDAWLVRTFEGHTDAIDTVRFSPDGRYALSGSHDRSIRIWDLQTGTGFAMPQEHRLPISATAFSPDGRYLVSGNKTHDYRGNSGPSLRLWDLTRRQSIGSFHDHAKGISSAVFMPDSKSVFTGTWNEPFEAEETCIQRWDIRSGECVQTFKGHDDVVESLALSYDGTLLLSASRDTTLRLWEVSSGKCIRILNGHTGSVYSVAVTADDCYALSGGVDEVIRLWNLHSGECMGLLSGHTDTIHSVTLTPDGAYALSAGEDAVLRLWDLEQGKGASPECLRVFEGHVDAIMSVAISPDGRYGLSAGQDAIIRLWEFDWAWDV
jgi:WD40 repeat protein